MSSKPNIVYILADDMGYGDISCLNRDSRIATQHLDRIGREGMVFTDAHASSAVCTPSRYSILTGRYNWRSALKKSVLFGYDKHLIEDGRLTVASMLKAQGYRTACIGKWHLGLDWAQDKASADGVDYAQPIENGPTSFGFDYFFGISGSLDMPPYVYIENDRVTAVPDRVTKNEGKKTFWREGPTGSDFRHEEVLPTFLSKATETIRQCQDAPFFLYLPLPAPHTPILPTEPFQGASGTNEYGDFVLMCDHVVGEIARTLEECGIGENTILIYTSDNGCSPRADFDELRAVGHNPNYIFRGHKADIYEGGHRIPLLIRWPDQIPAGRVSHETVCLVDLFATVADILDVDIPDNAAEDSISNYAIWRGDSLGVPLRDATVHHSIDGSFSIRKGRWKLELCPGSGGWSDPKPGSEPADSPPYQLYDLHADVREQHNLYLQYPEIAETLTQELAQIVLSGRSTPGAPQLNTDGNTGPQSGWLEAFQK